MELSALASGSSGNCFYIGNKNSAVLVDCGISAKQIAERLALLKKSHESIKAIFITHEHSDHIKGIDVLARQLNIPVYGTKKTLGDRFICSNEALLNPIKNNECINIDGLKVQAFSKPHGAADPVSYQISASGKTASIITDVGYASENISESVAESDFLFMESNHDEMMLDAGPYPFYLKRWIKSNQGHLSNMQSALCILEHANSRLKNVVLSHLSQTNNLPKLALETFNFFMKERQDLKPSVYISHREKPTRLFCI